MPSTLPDAQGACDLGTDSDAARPTYLWAQDHDNNASTPLRCAGDDPQRESTFDVFGYDAAFAIAHALHDLIQVQAKVRIVGEELLQSLEKVSFEVIMAS